MQYLTYTIRGNDFNEAGAASRLVKDHLKRVGADPEAIRRTMIAAYEAEMNVVIHAHRGVLEARLGDCRVDVDVVDEGPGIPDVDEALREGFSTASSEARALGFGAGMGLPNIQRNSDTLEIDTTPGKGTRVSFSVSLRPACPTDVERPRSVAVVPGRCRQCLRCLAACPTAALRVRDGEPLLLEHLCIDCTACVAACEPAALTIDETGGEPERATELAALPPAFLAGFGGEAPPAVVARAVEACGFTRVVAADGHERALRDAVLDLAREAADGAAGSVTEGTKSDEKTAAAADETAAATPAGRRPLPLISPVCPAVINLVELRFPSLLPHLAPFASPWEALQDDTDDTSATFVVSCPSQRTALLERRASGLRGIMTPARLRERVAPLLAGHEAVAASSDRATASPADAGGETLVVTGMPHVLRVLEELEDGLLGDVLAVEPYVCGGGCFGSPLLAEDAAVATHRWQAAPLQGEAGAARPPRRPPAPRPGIRLDPDMSRAIAKLARLDELTRSLPGRDCGACGAPTCAALAEDIVLERASRAFCPYVTDEEAQS
ncbi:MAG TPA: (Fe-S)-binding protein [Thermoleophilia bacterium]|nr:(Fe-S)-binding protein [Thermoleophilia bacterium]